MEGGLLSLKWNNHKSTFFHVLSNVRRKKDSYADATLACDGKFYPVHKLVLSSCSEYFEEMFEQARQAHCKHPFIVLKDINCDELECLLSYMYVGEVNVVQEKLSGLIKAAECLKIKGLAVPDEEPNDTPIREKRPSENILSSEPKRRRHEENSYPNRTSFRESTNRNEERRKSSHDHSSNNKLNSSHSSSVGEETVNNNEDVRPSGDTSDNVHEVKTESFAEVDGPDEVLIDEPSEDAVKTEPADVDTMYLSDSNSISENKERLLMEGFGDASTENQQHFMDELLGNSSGSDARHMGEYVEGGESSMLPGGSQQQPMVKHGNRRKKSEVGGLPSQNHHTRSYDPASWLPQEILDFEDNYFPSESLPRDVQRAQLLYVNDCVPYEQLGDMRVAGTLKHRCPVCEKEIQDKRDFRHHYMVHTGEKPYQCIYCSYKARQRGTLNAHVRVTHPSQKPNK